jgi:histidinol-phosphate/aromatic aminotransferase/cobyric acid decarboxylase-like protein/NDP-sugar pyrophosphorylase family protein
LPCTARRETLRDIRQTDPHEGDATAPKNPSGVAVQKAIILAAGAGTRLTPFTDSMPKCLAPVNGVPILVNALTHLSDAGILEAVIVVGHQREQIYKLIGATFGRMTITYIESERYATTNNIYSLWLAREHLVEDVLLLEADVFFGRQLLDCMLSFHTQNLAAVASHQSWMSGTVALVDDKDSIQALLDSRHQGTDFDYSKVLKTINVYLLRGEFLSSYFVPHLDAFIASGDVNEFYEAIFHAMTYRQTHTLRAVRCDDIKWAEIDDENDRTAAEYLFATPDQRYDVVSRQHGGYWRYDLIDHSYLYNLYFPPESFFAYLRQHLRDLVLNYPVGQDMLATLTGRIINQPAERIVVGNGASELIKILSGRLSRRLIVPVPSFDEYANAAPEGHVLEYALDPASFELDVDGFAAEARRWEADVAVVVTPNNPTALLVPRSALLRLAKKLASHGCRLVIDESFMDFADDPDGYTLEKDMDRHPNVAILKSLSKAYGICGLRLGYMLTADDDFANAVRSELSIWNINGFAEAFLGFLPRFRREFASSCDRVRVDRRCLYDALRAIPGMVVYEPQANFVFCRLPPGAPSGPELTRQLFTRHGIYIKHCAQKTLPEAERYLRIASRTAPENRALVEALRDCIACHEVAGGG